jgi:hypothetical protein
MWSYSEIAGKRMFRRGDFVWVEQGGSQMKAMVTIASKNGRSLVVMFDGMFAGYVNMMPLLADEQGEYRDLISHSVVTVKKVEGGEAW